jgi:hypothetical protein
VNNALNIGFPSVGVKTLALGFFIGLISWEHIYDKNDVGLS